jgi:hypothetical protein
MQGIYIRYRKVYVPQEDLVPVNRIITIPGSSLTVNPNAKLELEEVRQQPLAPFHHELSEVLWVLFEDPSLHDTLGLAGLPSVSRHQRQTVSAWPELLVTSTRGSTAHVYAVDASQNS